MREVVLGNHEHAAGFLVQAVDDAWSYLSTYALKIVTMIEEGVYQRATGFTGSGVSEHARRLVYDYDVAVFVKYMEFYSFR